MEIAQSLPLLPGDPRLIDYIVCELKNQGIFDQFRKECIADVDTKPAYQNLRQRVEVTVDGFLSRQKWKPDLNKNQLREKLRKHILDSNFLEQGVERIVDQVVNPKIGSVFLPQVEDVVYKCLGLEKPDKSNVVDAQPLNVETDTLLPNDLEAVSPDSVKSHDKSTENPSVLCDSNDVEMKLVEGKQETEVKVERSIPSIESSYDSDDSKDDDFESPAFEPIDDLKHESPSVSQHSVNSDVNSRDSSDWHASNAESKAVVKSTHSQDSSDSTDEKSFDKTAIVYDSGEDANMASPIKMKIESNETNFKLTNEDNSSDARQCFETKPRQDERMECEDSGDDVFARSEQKNKDFIKNSTSSEIGEPIKHLRTSIESKGSYDSNKPTPNMDASMDSSDSKGSSVFTPPPKDSYVVKDTYTFANKISTFSEKSIDDTSNSNDLKIDLQESEENIKNIKNLSISCSEDLKSPEDQSNINTKDEFTKKFERSDSQKSIRDTEKHSSSSHHSKDRKDVSKHQSKSSHSKHSSRHDDRRHSSSHDRRDGSRKTSKDHHSSDRDSKRDKYHKSNYEDRDRDKYISSSNKTSSSSRRHSSHKSSSSSRHDDKHRHSTLEKSSDRYEKYSSSKHESKDSHKNKESSRESSRDKSSSRTNEKSSEYSSHDKNKHSSYKEKSSNSKHSSSSNSDRHRKSSSGDKKHDERKTKERPDKDEQCSSVKSNRNRRSTDRDSNDGNDGPTKHSSSSSASNHQSSTNEKSSHHGKSGHSNSNTSSGQSDSGEVVDKVKVSAGGYIKSEFDMFQPVVKKSPSLPQLHRSPDNVVSSPGGAPKKPVIHIDSQLNPNKEELSPELPMTPQVERIKKPKIASNIFEARKLMKVRKNIDILEKCQMQEARVELEKLKNIPQNQSKVYSGTSGPELQIICRKRSISNPNSPKAGSFDSEKESLHFFDEESVSKAVAASEKCKKHLKHLLALHNGISQKNDSVLYLINSDKCVENAFIQLSSKNHLIRTVNVQRNDIVRKQKISPLKLEIPANSEVSLPSSSKCVVELNDLKYDDNYGDILKSKCLPLKKRKMSEPKLIRDIKPNVFVEFKPNVVEEKSMLQTYNSFDDDDDYLDYRSQVDDALSKASKQDIMEIIFGGGVSFDTALVDLNHLKNEGGHVDSSINGKSLQNKKRRISFKGSDDIIEPGMTYNNNVREHNESSSAKRRNMGASNETHCDSVSTNNRICGVTSINSILCNNSWGKSRRVGLSREVKPLKGIIRNKTAQPRESPDSPDSDKSVENHLNSDDGLDQKSSNNYKENSQDISSSALNQANHQNKNRAKLVRNKTMITKCINDNAFGPKIASTERV